VVHFAYDTATFAVDTVAGWATRFNDAISELLAEANGGREHASGQGVETIPLSYTQLDLWFMRSVTDDKWLVYPLVEIQGEVDRNAMEGAVNAVVARHDVLRTTIPRWPPAQRIHPHIDAALDFLDLATTPESDHAGLIEVHLRSLAHSLWEVAPMCRFSLVRRSEGEYAFAGVFTHIAIDRPAMELVMAEIGVAYMALVLEAPIELAKAASLAAYVHEERHRMIGFRGQAAEAGWLSELDGARQYSLKPSCFGSDSGPGARAARIDASMIADAERFTNQHGMTLKMYLMAATVAALHRFNGQGDISVRYLVQGMARATRSSGVLVAPAYRELVARVRNAGSTKASIAGEVRNAVLFGMDNADCPWIVPLSLLERSRWSGWIRPLLPVFGSFCDWIAARFSPKRLQYPGLAHYYAYLIHPASMSLFGKFSHVFRRHPKGYVDVLFNYVAASLMPEAAQNRWGGLEARRADLQVEDSNANPYWQKRSLEFNFYWDNTGQLVAMVSGAGLRDEALVGLLGQLTSVLDEWRTGQGD